MENTRLQPFYKKPLFLLFFLLVVFFLKGAFFSVILPFLQGFDEDKHFATVQYFAEPKEKTWPITNTSGKISGTNYSEEEIQTSEIVRFSSMRMNSMNTPFFVDGLIGQQEADVLAMPWKKYVDKYPPVLTGHPPLYYLITSTVLKMFWDKDVFTRIAAIRLFSIIFGMLTVLLFFLIARKIGFSEKISVILAAILAFQPLFTQTSATINTDNLLTLAFTLFVFGGVHIISDGISWKNFAVPLVAIAIGIFTKSPALAMFPVAYFLYAYAFYQKFQPRKKFFLIGFPLATAAIAIILFFTLPKSLTTYGSSSKFSSVYESFTRYVPVSFKHFQGYELSYWGNFGLLNTPISSDFLYIIWTIEGISFLGLLFFLFKKDPPTFFRPDKKILVFLLMVTASLQVAVRYADWQVFDSYGKIVLKTHGRYFLPTIACHIILVLAGYLVIFRKQKTYENFVKLVLIFMALLFFYSEFTIIIPRYYL